MSELAGTTNISACFFNMLIQSCSEFVGAHSDINIELSGVSWEEADPEVPTPAELELSVTVAHEDQEKVFKFTGTVGPGDVIELGPYLVNTSVTVPCAVELRGQPGLECTGPCRVTARSVRIDTPELIIRGVSQHEGASIESGLFVNTDRATGHADTVSPKGGTIEIGCGGDTLDYPLARYAQRIANPPTDPALAEKFLRFRRIMLEFRSHKRGGLAKFRQKIEHERVIRNDLGRRVLAQLVKDGIRWVDQKFYYVDQERFSAELGITWKQLRQHQSSPQLEAYLRRVP